MDTHGLLLAFDRAGHRCYPVWQFDCSGAPVVRPWIAPLIETMGGAPAALHFLLTPRKSAGIAGSYQPYLTRVLMNESAAIRAMMRHANDFANEGHAGKPSAEH